MNEDGTPGLIFSGNIDNLFVSTREDASAFTDSFLHSGDFP
jgi:hypothetical protein